MEALHTLLVSVLEDTCFKRVAAKLVVDKLEDMGITLNEQQLEELEAELEQNQPDTWKLNLDDDQLSSSKIKLVEGQPIEIEIDEADIDNVSRTINETIASTLPSITSETADDLLSELKTNAAILLKEQTEQCAQFESRIREVWGKALDLLEMFLSIAREVGDYYNEQFRQTASQDEDYVFEVLTRLHARACQIGFEIHTLLKSGYADGAHARWRTLHEISAIAYFVTKHGNPVAERYLCHGAVESYRAAGQYQKHCESLGYEQMSDEEMAELKAARDHMIDRFGSSFRNQYGWASHALGKDHPYLSDIERDVNLEHLRPFYKLASQNVHAGPKGILFRLGLHPAYENVLLAGPSMAGLADPGQGTAMSLLQITATLLTTKPSLDRLVACNVLQKLHQETGEAFLDAHFDLETQDVA